MLKYILDVTFSHLLLYVPEIRDFDVYYYLKNKEHLLKFLGLETAQDIILEWNILNTTVFSCMHKCYTALTKKLKKCIFALLYCVCSM